MKKLMIIGAAAVSLIAPLVNGEVVYQNDFATRTSAGAVPCGEWREVPYVTGKLVNDGYSNSIEVFRDTDLQDNWIRGRNSGASYAYVIDDNGNPEALLFSGETDYANHIIVKHRLGNTFTTGVVTAQCDFKPPEDWLWYSSKHVRLLLGDETFYSPVTSMDDFTKYLAAGAGVGMNGNTNPGNEYKFVPYGADISSLPANAKKGIWYRVVITANLDTKKYGFAMYEMGAEHPALDAETPATIAYAENGIDFWSVTKGVVANGISSIGIAGYGIAGTSDASLRAKTAQVDNIRVAHNGVECYVNDFSSRKLRVFGGATTATYELNSVLTNSVQSEVYVLDTNIVPDRENSGTTVQPIGIDGWRRVANQWAEGNAQVRNDGSGTYLRFSGGGSSAYLGQLFGTSVSSGKVRLSVDVRLPSNWPSSSSGALWVALGNDEYYNAVPADANNYRFAAVGIRGETNTPTYVKPSGSQNPSPSADISASHWYRIVVTADLDNDTTAFSVYEQGTAYPVKATADGTLIYNTDSIGKLNGSNVQSLSSFSLAALNVVVWFDNIKVWHISADGGTESLLYENYFSTRTCYLNGGRIVGTLAKNPVGIDGWTRQYRTTDDFLLVGGENPALGFNSVDKDYSNYAVHDLGGAYKGGKATVRFDVCAPSAWLQNDGFAYVWLGGDQYHEGNINGGSSGPNYFQRWAAFGVGLSYTKFAAFAGDGSGGGTWQKSSSTTTAGHWYRFVVKSDFHACTSDVVVYDMGAEQPTFATATPTTDAVATFTSLPFRQNAVKRSGLTSIGIQAKGVKAANPLLPTEYRILLDNLSVEHAPAGFILTIK